MNRIHLILISGILLLQACGGIKRMEKRLPLSISPAKLELVTNQKTNPYTILVEYTLTIPREYVPSCGRLIYAPRFVAGKNEYTLPPLIINGKIFNRIENRTLALGNAIADNPEAVRVVAENQGMQVKMSQRIPFQLWMPASKLIAVSILDVCGHETTLSTQTLAEGVMYIPLDLGPVRVKYVQKEIQKKEEGTARFYYPVNHYNVDPALYNNQEQLDKIDNLITKISADPLMYITQIVITGISSPDGPYAYNQTLAKERAMAIKNYLVKGFQLNSNLFTVKEIAEDWTGLRKLITESAIPDKSAVLRILDRTTDDETREIALYELPQYTYIRENLLPQLRRVVYEIFYTAKQIEEEPVPE